jgi:hypothetical protein
MGSFPIVVDGSICFAGHLRQALAARTAPAKALTISRVVAARTGAEGPDPRAARVSQEKTAIFQYFL